MLGYLLARLQLINLPLLQWDSVVLHKLQKRSALLGDGVECFLWQPQQLDVCDACTACCVRARYMAESSDGTFPLFRRINALGLVTTTEKLQQQESRRLSACPVHQSAPLLSNLPTQTGDERTGTDYLEICHWHCQPQTQTSGRLHDL